MTPLEQSLRQAVADLCDLGCSFALVGGLAVSVRAEPRMTRDADLAVAAETDAQAEHVVLQLQQRGYVVSALVEEVATGRNRHRAAPAGR